MDVGADAAGQVISLAGQVFKIGMEGMVVVVKIAGKGAVHAAALLAAALSGKKKTRGKVMLKNMLRDSKGITLFTIRDQDLKKFAKEAKAYNVRYCIVKDRKQDRDGNTDMFIRAEDAAVVNRIIERFGLTAVKQDVSIEGTPEAESAYGEPVKDEDYVYGDVTISREINSLVEGETETQIKTRVPGTYGKNVRYVYFDKAGLEEVHGGKSYKVHIDPEGSYELYGADGTAAETVKGEELLRHYDRHDSETPGNSKARTASGAQSGRSYSGQEDETAMAADAAEASPAAGIPESTKTADREEKPAPAYVYGDVTISRDKNSLVEEETETQIRTRVPGTYGKDVRYVYFDKDGLEEVHGDKSYKVHIDPESSYELYGADGTAAETVKGEELLRHYDRHDSETPGNSKARTASGAQSGKSYSGQGVTEKDAVTCIAFESYYEYSRNDERYLFDERCRLLSIGEDGSVGAYPGHEGFFKNEDELNAFLAGHGELRLVTKDELKEMAAGRSAAPEGGRVQNEAESAAEKSGSAARSHESTKTAKGEEKPAPAYVYGDVTISRDKNSLVEEETETQIKTRVPGTYKKDARYVYFDKAGLEEVHGGRSYKVHIEPERIYELYDRSGAAAGSVYGEELLTHYDRKDRDGVAAKDPEVVKTSQSEKSAAEPAPPEPSSEKSYEDAVHEGTDNSRIPDTKNRFNRFSQRTYDFAAMDKELLSNNDEPEPEEPGADTGQSDAVPVHENKESPGTTVKTNMGEMPVEDYREIMAGQYGFDSYEEFYAKGWRLGDGYDKDPEPRSEAELRPSVREKLSGYKKEEEDAAIKRQIEAAQAKRAAETRELEKTGGDVLPGQREKINPYKESRDAAMADFLSDAKLNDRG